CGAFHAPMSSRSNDPQAPPSDRAVRPVVGAGMNTRTKVVAADGHELDALFASPETKPKHGMVVVQEIFGVNSHIRAVCEDFARQGYAAIAPALFDRIEPGVELGYDEAAAQRGRALRTELGWDLPLLDLRAAAARLEDELDLDEGRTGIVGFCWGGSLA